MRVFLASFLLGANLLAGSVAGHVRLVASKDSAVQKDNDYSGVVVWLESPEASADVRPARKHAEMLQKDKKFIPHILAITKGTTVDFPNLDPIFHNAFSNFDGKIFDVALYPPGSSRSVRFNKSGIVRVFCNIHPSMSAIIVVADSNYVTITDQEGSFSFQDVQPGTYELHVFHERSTPETLDNLARKIAVKEEALTLPLLSVSEAGYLPTSHKNKYGRDYPANSENQGYSLPLP